jgi:hypothetical protein
MEEEEEELRKAVEVGRRTHQSRSEPLSAAVSSRRFSTSHWIAVSLVPARDRGSKKQKGRKRRHVRSQASRHE